MKNLSVRKGDTVLVISGKDNGKQGKIKAVSPKSNRVIVEGVNFVSKHKKAKNTQEKSQIIKAEAPIDASNVMVVCPHCKKATRVAHKELEGKNHRVCKKCGEGLDTKFVKPKKETKKVVTKAVKEEAKVEKVEKAEKPAKKTTTKATTKTTATKKATKTEKETKDAKKTTKKASKKAE